MIWSTRYDLASFVLDDLIDFLEESNRIYYTDDMYKDMEAVFRKLNDSDMYEEQVAKINWTMGFEGYYHIVIMKIEDNVDYELPKSKR